MHDQRQFVVRSYCTAKLIYSAITSLDGYVADKDGNFDWAEPDDEVHAFVNDLERRAGTYLYGRRMYEVMCSWETAHTLASSAPFTCSEFSASLRGRPAWDSFPWRSRSQPVVDWLRASSGTQALAW